MEQRINLIFKIEHVKLQHVISITSTASGSGTIAFSESFEIPISKSSGRYRISSNRSAAGVSYNVSLQANLIAEISDLHPGVYILTLENGSKYLIGTRDYPVRYNSDETLNEKSFSLNYKSRLKPLKIAN